MIGGGNVVQRQKHARDHLRDEDEQKRRTEHIGKPRTTGYWFVESFAQKAIQSGSRVDPVKQTLCIGCSERRLGTGGFAHAFRVSFLAAPTWPMTSFVGTSWRKY